MESSGIRYASVGTARVAYEVHGAGDLDIVYSPGLASHLDLTMEQPRFRRYVEQLARLGRAIRFDRRGCGLSDPVPPGAEEGWEMWADDLSAVLDAAGSRQAAIIATNDAGPAAVLYAATRPDRVMALVLFNTTARFLAAPDYPEGHPSEVADLVVEVLRTAWGTEDSTALLSPSLAADDAYRRWYARFQRAACRPAEMAESMRRLLQLDARHVLPEVACPTLVLHRDEYGTAPPAQGRFLASAIPNARFEPLPGADATIYTEGTDEILRLIADFLGRTEAAPASDSTFATVLFTDIVGSTELAASLGDAAWHELLEAHDAAARHAVVDGGGAVIKTTGDGILARFDAPSRAIRAATGMRAAVAPLGIGIRAGVHAGPLVVRTDGDVAGLAVHIAARVLSLAGEGELLATDSVLDLLTDDAVFGEDRGEQELRGIPGTHRVHAVTVAPSS